MKSRIRKKKLALKIYHINQAIIKNTYLRDKYKNDSDVNGLVAKFALPVADVGLELKRKFLTSKLKRGDY